MREEILKMLKSRPELLPEPYYTLTQIMGVDSVIRLGNQYGGDLIYLPKMDKAATNARNACIRQEYTGYNSRELATKYRLTVQSIKRIVSYGESGKTSLSK